MQGHTGVPRSGSRPGRGHCRNQGVKIVFPGPAPGVLQAPPPPTGSNAAFTTTPPPHQAAFGHVCLPQVLASVTHALCFVLRSAASWAIIGWVGKVAIRAFLWHYASLSVLSSHGVLRGHGVRMSVTIPGLPHGSANPRILPPGTRTCGL